MNGRNNGTLLSGRFIGVALLTLLITAVAGCSKATPPVEPGTQPSVVSDPPSDTMPIVRASSEIRIDNAMAGWLDSGLSVSTGDSVALFAKGSLAAEGLTFEPRHMMWYRNWRERLSSSI